MAPLPFEDFLRQLQSTTPELVENTNSSCEKEQSTDCQESKSIPLSLFVHGLFARPDEYYTTDFDAEDYEYVPMVRCRLNTTDPDKDDYDPGRFIPIEGLDADDGPHEFYHNDLSDDEDEDDKMGDRAVLFQSLENYETVSKCQRLAPYMLLADKDKLSEDQPLTLPEQEVLLKRALEDPRFGEQVIVEGATPSNISVGDIFEVAGGASTLKIQVTCPRKPCYALDKKNATPKGARGIKRYCMNTGLAGWFTSVLVAGELRDGMVLVRTDHPYPKWTLENLSQALYGGEGDPKALLLGKPSWGRSREELEELVAMDILCDYEWKEELTGLLKLKELDEEDERMEEEQRLQRLQESMCLESPLYAFCISVHESLDNILSCEALSWHAVGCM